MPLPNLWRLLGVSQSGIDYPPTLLLRQLDSETVPVDFMHILLCGWPRESCGRIFEIGQCMADIIVEGSSPYITLSSPGLCKSFQDYPRVADLRIGRPFVQRCGSSSPYCCWRRPQMLIVRFLRLLSVIRRHSLAIRYFHPLGRERKGNTDQRLGRRPQD